MAITYSWNIIEIESKPTVGTYTDYVVTAHWTLSGIDSSYESSVYRTISETDNAYVGSVYGTVSFEVDFDKPNYTPYEDLTLEEVIAWTQASLGAEQVASYEKCVADQIEAQINPTIVTPPLPWL
jgi:hypothetical protein